MALKKALVWILSRLLKERLRRLDNVRKLVAKAKDEVDEDSYDFYRCHGCRYFITRLDELEFMDQHHPRWGKVCRRCGSSKYRPIDWTYLSTWEKLQPRVLYFALLRYVGLA